MSAVKVRPDRKVPRAKPDPLVQLAMLDLWAQRVHKALRAM